MAPGGGWVPSVRGFLLFRASGSLPIANLLGRQPEALEQGPAQQGQAVAGGGGIPRSEGPGSATKAGKAKPRGKPQ